jgi:SAM-dependent methyltransferase
MPVLAWDHNAYYDRLLLRVLPNRVQHVLDVGCGAGRLATALATRAGCVDAVDRDETMIAAARRQVPGNVTCVLADVMDLPLAAGSYDAIMSMTALHHLPLAPSLQRLSEALRPGGVLAVVAVPRRDLFRDLPIDLAATTWHHLVGWGLVAGAATGRGWGSRLRLVPEHDHMPMRDPELTTRQVRQQAAAVLPGVRVRRLLLWRYLLTWRRPTETKQRSSP